MFCPSCGAPNNDPGQRYCRECGATLPLESAPKAIAHRPHGAELPYAPSTRGRSSALVSQSLKKKAIAGAIGMVVLVAALYIVIKVVIATVTAILLPLVVLLAAGFLGYVYLKNLRKR